MVSAEVCTVTIPRTYDSINVKADCVGTIEERTKEANLLTNSITADEESVVELRRTVASASALIVVKSPLALSTVIILLMPVQYSNAVLVAFIIADSVTSVVKSNDDMVIAERKLIHP